MKMEVKYLGELRSRAKHYSGAELITDAPVDNHGKGESFSPTDLLCTALATCLISIMGIEAMKLGIPFEGAEANIQKIMALNPRRVSRIVVDVRMSSELENSPYREKLEYAALNCPVALSLHPDIKQEITFVYG